MIRAVVFDLDGTLVDSLSDIAFVVNATLVAHGRPAHTLESFRSMVGWGLRSLLATASRDQPFSEEEGTVAFEELLQAYRQRPVVETHPYPGIEPLLESLSGRVILGVLSNKEEGMTQAIVNRLFPNVSFRSVEGARPDRPPKPDPTALSQMIARWGISPDETAYLGDSGVDMETARGAGVLACGALWGFRDEVELRSAGALEVFSDPGAFGQWLAHPAGQNLTTNRN